MRRRQPATPPRRRLVGETPGVIAGGAPSPTVAPTPTPVVPAAFPLPVVTGLTNLKAAITA